MNNNAEFMKVFNNIEKKLRENIDAFRNVPFYELIDRNSEHNKLVSQYNSELKTLGDLRNFIVHGDIGDPLAVVTKKTIERIKHIEKELYNPVKIKEVFSKNVIGVREETSLSAILDIIKEKKYSQFPVLGEEGFKGLITENGITSWLANNIETDCISIKEVTIKDIMKEEREKESYGILSSDDTLYDVIKMFERSSKTKERTFVVIVLESPKEKFLLKDMYTIIASWDLKDVYRNLGIEL